jgi:prepilin-type N-terminal cleavage/methylation domain-containing protein
MTHSDPPPTRQAGRGEPLRCGGFTLVELITVIIILGLLSAALISRSGTLGGQELARMAEVRAQLRYVQLRAIKSNSVCGFACDGVNYWAFSGNDPALAANLLPLPGETGSQVSVAGKNMTMTMSVSPVYFDGFGIPYTAYTSASVNTKLAASATITVTAGGSTGALTITPETGYVP